jgi:predicted dehydrogenase
MARKAARGCDVVVATYDELIGFGLQDLAGKTVVTSAISDDRLAELASRGVDMVLDATPQPFHVTVVTAVLEAMMLATVSSSGA